MKVTVQLDSKDVRAALALFFGVKFEDVIPNRYSFSIAGLNAEEIEKRLHPDEEAEAQPQNSKNQMI